MCYNVLVEPSNSSALISSTATSLHTGMLFEIYWVSFVKLLNRELAFTGSQKSIRSMKMSKSGRRSCSWSSRTKQQSSTKSKQCSSTAKVRSLKLFSDGPALVQFQIALSFQPLSSEAKGIWFSWGSTSLLREVILLLLKLKVDKFLICLFQARLFGANSMKNVMTQLA